MSRMLGLGATHADTYFWIADDQPHDSDTCIERECAECAALRAGDDEEVFCRAIIEVWEASASGPKEAVTCDEITNGGPLCAAHLEMQKRAMEER